MDGFLGEIRAFAFSYAPRDWMLCNGQTVSLQSNSALFAIIGARYGGNGTTNFQLPNLNGRATMSQGQGPGLSSYSVGQTSGEESHLLDQGEMPAHNHLVRGKVVAGSSSGLRAEPSSATYLSRLANSLGTAAIGYYKPPLANATVMAAGMISSAGGGLPHENRQPLLPLVVCICVSGIFPQHS